MTSPLPLLPPAIVFDTNVVLDWLVFANPETTPIRLAIEAGSVRWIATAAMREELGFILAGGTLAPWKPDPGAVWATWKQYCTEVSFPVAGNPIGRPRCSDPDDQMFIDLAISESARWLVSRDRAVLKLARKLRTFGVEVVTPPQWRIDSTTTEHARQA